MRSAAFGFTVQFLYEDPNTGYLISSPSNSPGNWCVLVARPTYGIISFDQALFKKSIAKASKILNTDQEFASTLGPMIAKDCSKPNWKHATVTGMVEDKMTRKKSSRHVSHLWAGSPRNEINYEDTPDKWRLPKQCLWNTSDNGTGWRFGLEN